MNNYKTLVAWKRFVIKKVIMFCIILSNDLMFLCVLIVCANAPQTKQRKKYFRRNVIFVNFGNCGTRNLYKFCKNQIWWQSIGEKKDLIKVKTWLVTYSFFSQNWKNNFPNPEESFTGSIEFRDASVNFI